MPQPVKRRVHIVATSPLTLVRDASRRRVGGGDDSASSDKVVSTNSMVSLTKHASLHEYECKGFTALVSCFLLRLSFRLNYDRRPQEAVSLHLVLCDGNILNVTTVIFALISLNV